MIGFSLSFAFLVSMFAPKGMGTHGDDAMPPSVMPPLFKLHDHGCSRPSSVDVSGIAVCAGRP